MNKKRAFTMVELIFVIVILGILAAVAVPKLNASRADAKTAALKANLVTLAKDFETYYAANGSYCALVNGKGCMARVEEITSAPFDRIEPGNISGSSGYFQINGKDCIKVIAEQYSTGMQMWTISVFNDSDCLKELDDKAYKDIKWIFEGYRSYSAGNFSDHGDVREKPGNWARHLMSDPSKSVEW